MRRDSIKAALRLLAACLLCATGVASAADYPTRPIRLIVGFTAGGGADFVARQVAQHLAQALDTSVVVDNKPGANGTLAAADVARMPADGYTLLLGVSASQSISPVLMPKLPYDPLRDFTPITQVGYTPLVLVVNNRTPAKNVGEFVRYVNSSIDPVTYGSAGTGNITHMAAELHDESPAHSLQGQQPGHHRPARRTYLRLFRHPALVAPLHPERAAQGTGRHQR